MKTDFEFFARRAREERALAASAADPRLAASHARLADQYDALIAVYAEAGQPPVAKT